MDQYLRLLWLIPLGFFTGGYGTLIGAGGGFVLAPALLLLYPGEAPETITSILLAVVFFNALSGTLAYAKSKRIDYMSGFIFSLASIPGAVIGALATTAISREGFDLLFGFLLVCVAIVLAFTTARQGTTRIAQADFKTPTISNLSASTLLLGSVLSTAFGFLSSFLGIGGGFLYVPALVYSIEISRPYRHGDLPVRLDNHGFHGQRDSCGRRSIPPRPTSCARAFDWRDSRRASRRQIITAYSRRLDYSQPRYRTRFGWGATHRILAVVNSFAEDYSPNKRGLEHVATQVHDDVGYGPGVSAG
jgi:uncharacterized membrane protein YfcA